MSMFKRKHHEVPGLNTASLPDLVFTVLFFFMIVTHIRETELKVDYDVPEGQRMERMEGKRAIVYIHIGRPTGSDGRAGEAAQEAETIQLGDHQATIADIPRFIAKERAQMSADDAARMTVCIKADQHTRMGVIDDVKRALAEAGVTKVLYAGAHR